jgi:hypothetical protein
MATQANPLLAVYRRSALHLFPSSQRIIRHQPCQSGSAVLMDRYFDAHLYVAYWATHEFMLRLPHRLLGMERVAP